MDSKEFLISKGLITSGNIFKIIKEDGEEIILNDLLDEFSNLNSSDRYVRLLADFDNYKKRVSKDKQDLVSKTKFETLSSIINFYDEINLSIKYFSGDVKQSITNLSDKVMNFLKSEGVEEIQVDTYDSELHEVVQVVEGEGSKIVEVLSRGYSIGDRILKYPKIILSK
jgi:molecular chaperone GrpE